MTTSYDLSVGALAEDERGRVDEILREWSSTRPVGRTIADNLKKEHFLPKECMDDLLRCVIDEEAGGFENLEPAYEATCHSHVVRGGPIQAEILVRLGASSASILSRFACCSTMVGGTS